MHTNSKTDSADFDFGPRNFYSEETKAFWDQHAAIVRSWLKEMKAADNDFWRSARHAAFCLVSFREFEAEQRDEPPHWREFDVEKFLFSDLQEAGTVCLFGSVSIFFDQLLEGLRRFCDGGLIVPGLLQVWLAAFEAARPRFLDQYQDPE